MNGKTVVIVLVLLSINVFIGCTPLSNASPTNTIMVSTDTITPISTYTSTITLTSTLTLTSTSTHILTPSITESNSVTPTPQPITVTLGSPFAADCGGDPTQLYMLANDAFNGPWDSSQVQEGHGHVDISHQDGCNPYTYDGEVVAPVDGYYSVYSKGAHITLPEGTLLDGTLEALYFAGVDNPSLTKIERTWIDIGHIMNYAPDGSVQAGEPIADIDPNTQTPPPLIIGYKVFLMYDGTQYMLSPSLFPGVNWSCHPLALHDCEAEPFDYP